MKRIAAAACMAAVRFSSRFSKSFFFTIIKPEAYEDPLHI